MPKGRTPARDLKFFLGTFAIVPVLGLVALVVLYAAGGLPSVPAGVFAVIVVGLLALFVGTLALALLLGRRLVGDRIEFAFRRFGQKWRQGRADVDAGHVRLQPYWWQLRIPTGDPIDLEVRDVGLDERKPPAREWWSVNPQVRIVTVETDGGGYEFGALPSHLAEFRERVATP